MKSNYSHMLMLVVMVLVTVGVGLLYTYMHYAVGKSVTKALVAETIVAAQESSNAQQKSTEDIYHQTVADRVRLTSFFVSDDQAVTFIESIEALGPAAGSTVTLANVSADETAGLAAGSLAHIKAHVDAVGPWSSVMRTLLLAEVLPYQSTLDNVHLDSTPGDDKGGKTVWHIGFDISAGLIVHSKKP